MSYVNPEAVTRGIKPSFRNIKAYDRFKRLQLGLPVNVGVNTDKLRIPWGYDRHPFYHDFCLPDIFALRLLYKSKEYLKTCSLKEVARWLSVETNRKITGEGLRLLIINRFPFREIMLSDDERERIYRTPTTFLPDPEKAPVEEESEDDNEDSGSREAS